MLSPHKIKTSEMLIAAINAPSLDIKCHNLENWAYVDTFGDLWGCCRCWPYYPHGNVLKDGADAFDNYFARILKLTSLNRNYALCNFGICKYNHREYKEHYQIDYISPLIPTEITVAHDKRCNLKCPSCRKEFCLPTPDEEQRSHDISQKLIASGWLSKSELIVAGDGEVFYSQAYRDLIQSNLKRNKIVLLTNGTLFNEKNYQLIKNKYEHIVVMLSLDAATKETYKLLRGANFDNLLKNLKMIGKLRALDEIKYFVINFTIQKANYREIKKLIKLCQELNVDSINLTRLNNWGTFTDEEYLEKSMIIDNSYYCKEVYEYFDDPIFDLPIVDLGPIKGLLDNSIEMYKK